MTQKKWPDNLKDWQKSQTKTYRTYIKTSAVGLEFALAIGISALVGYYLDKRFGWAPWGLNYRHAYWYYCGRKAFVDF